MRVLKPITFQEFIDTYFPHLSQNEIAEKMELTPAGVSKLKKGSGDVSPTSNTWKKAKRFVLIYCGKDLLAVNKEKNELEIARNYIKELEEKIAQKDIQIAKLTDSLVEVSRSVKLMSGIKDIIYKTEDKNKIQKAYHGSGAMTRSPSPLAWRPDFPGAPREAH